jgi:hypothetical protein
VDMSRLLEKIDALKAHFWTANMAVAFLLHCMKSGPGRFCCKTRD